VTGVPQRRTADPRRVFILAALGAMLLGFSVVHMVWTGFHAPLSAWVAPVGAALMLGALWGLATGRRLPRWATVVLVVLGAALGTLLVLSAILFVLTNEDISA
jgi:peptidoglycan/LPS O-acetylase OafA/YrhL